MRNLAHRWLRPTAFALAFSFTPLSSAQSAKAPSETEADALFAQGKELSSKGKLEDAYEAYKRAFELARRFDIAGNLGRTEIELKRYAQAAGHLSFCLDHLPEGSTDAQRARVAELLDDARRRIAVLRVKVNLEGAAVSVDGVSAGTSPIDEQIFLEPGPHAVQATLDGYRTAQEELTATAGGTFTSSLVLLPLDGSAPVAAPPPPVAAPPAAPPRNDGDEGPSAVPIVVGSSLAAGGIIAGFVFMTLSNGKASDANALRQPGGSSACLDAALAAPCGELRSALEGRDTFGNIAMGAFIGGGAAALGTLGYVLFAQDAPAQTGSLRVSTTVGAAPGLRLEGTF